jgi:hypothetical protein
MSPVGRERFVVLAQKHGITAVWLNEVTWKIISMW